MATPASFKIDFSFDKVVRNVKITFGKLYLRQIISGPGTNQSDVLEANTATGLGKTTVNNWEIYDGLTSVAELVAYGQGMHTNAGNWQNWFTMVFEIQRFKGSTLQIMGASLDKSNEWAIVGGTGEFAMAHGVIRRAEYKFTGDEKIHELTIDGYCSMNLPTPTMMGPWGGGAGTIREMVGKSRCLKSMTIRSRNAVERIAFTYADEEGKISTAGPWESTSSLTGFDKTITFGPSEFVKEMTGTTYSDKEPYLANFMIVTNIATYGPFGIKTSGASFKAIVPEDKTVVGFFVYDNGSAVFKIGAYTI